MILRCLLVMGLIGCGSGKSDSAPDEPVTAEATNREAAEKTLEEAPGKKAPEEMSEKAQAETCAQAPTWRFERIELPPGFAPTLAKGVEKLYFAPGMFKEGAADYWSYVFSLRFDDAQALDRDAVTKLLFDYYNGLLRAVAKGKSLPEPKDVVVKVSEPTGGFEATVEATDAFVTGKPITIRLLLTASTDKTCLNVAASVAPAGSAIWTELETARKCVPCSP